MTGTCLSCGKPLGNRNGLCYGCERDGVDVADVVDVDDAVRERVERYFVVSSLRCADCGELHTTVTVDGESYTADDFGIDSVEEWELELDKEEAWLRENERAVRAATLELDDEWPQTARAVREHVLG
jgi:hypothetical protein